MVEEQLSQRHQIVYTHASGRYTRQGFCRLEWADVVVESTYREETSHSNASRLFTACLGVYNIRHKSDAAH